MSLLLKLSRHACVLFGIAGLVFTSTRITTAQTMADGSHEVVEVPAQQLHQIQQELQFLRARDAER